MGYNPKFFPKRPYSKCDDGSQEEVSQKPPDYPAVAHVQMQVHLWSKYLI